MPKRYVPKPPTAAAARSTLAWCSLMLESYKQNLIEAQRAGAAIDELWIIEAQQHERTVKALAAHIPGSRAPAVTAGGGAKRGGV